MTLSPEWASAADGLFWSFREQLDVDNSCATQLNQQRNFQVNVCFFVRTSCTCCFLRCWHISHSSTRAKWTFWGQNELHLLVHLFVGWIAVVSKFTNTDRNRPASSKTFSSYTTMISRVSKTRVDREQFLVWVFMPRNSSNGTSYMKDLNFMK